MSPASFRPAVLFADEDESALHRILVRIEPLIITFSLRQQRPLRAYIEQCKPEVLVFSDRFAGGDAKLRAVLAEVKTMCTLPILILVEEVTPGVLARWQQAGATDVIIHPGRVEARIEAMLQRILAVAYDTGAA